jgi:RHS repeat-associated protein
LNSVTALVSTAGVLANTYSYDPWGQTIASTGAVYNPWQFTSSYNDTATGLYQMGARYDQPASGRFTQLDPLPRSLISANRYAYAGCNPANFTDPTGLSHCNNWQILSYGLAAVGGSLITVGEAISFAATLPTGIGPYAAALLFLGTVAVTSASYIAFFDCLLN